MNGQLLTERQVGLWSTGATVRPQTGKDGGDRCHSRILVAAVVPHPHACQTQHTSPLHYTVHTHTTHKYRYTVKHTLYTLLIQ